MKLKINYIFLISIILCMFFIILGVFLPQEFKDKSAMLTNFIAVHFSWYYLILVFSLFILCIILLFSKHNSIVLGNESEEPEFSLMSWFAMLFSAGMGMGLVFGRLLSLSIMLLLLLRYMKKDLKLLSKKRYNIHFFIGESMLGRFMEL